MLASSSFSMHVLEPVYSMQQGLDEICGLKCHRFSSTKKATLPGNFPLYSAEAGAKVKSAV